MLLSFPRCFLIILLNSNQYLHGRVVGFSDKVHIPLLVIGFDDMDTLQAQENTQENGNDLTYIILPAISSTGTLSFPIFQNASSNITNSPENSVIESLYHTFKSFVVVNSFLYPHVILSFELF